MSDQLLRIVADTRCPSAVIAGTRPFAGSTISEGPMTDTQPVRRDFIIVASIEASQLLGMRVVLFVGQLASRSIGLGPLQRRAIQVVQRPHATQVGIAPGCARRLPGVRPG
jgi:hypothetical protein